MTDTSSSIAPRPRPGFRSRPARVAASDKAALFASTLRALLGVFCLGVAVLWFPPVMVTPILSGVSVLMIVSGASSSWQVGRREPRLKPFAKGVYWGAPVLGGLVFVVMLFVGGGGLGPSWEELAGAKQEPATFVPGEDAR